MARPRFLSRPPIWLVLVMLPWTLFDTGCGGTQVRSRRFVFYPAAPDTARYQFLTRLRSSEDINPQSGFNKAILGEKPIFPLGKPYGITLLGERLYVVDTQLKGLVRIDFSKKNMFLLKKIDDVPFVNPLNLTRDAQGNLYVCDVGAKRIFVFTPEEKLLRAYGDGASVTPLDVGVGERVLYVVDKESHEVLLLDRETGRVLGSCDASPDSLGDLSWPTNVAVAPDGRVYVVDTMRARVYCFDADGNYLFGFGERGDWVGTFARPKGIAVDREGHVLVVDAAFENVQVFDAEGTPLTFLGGPGRQPGSMFLPAAIDAVYDPPSRFTRFAHDGVRVDYIVLVTSQFGPAHVDIYGKIANVEDFARRFPPALGYKQAALTGAASDSTGAGDTSTSSAIGPNQRNEPQGQ